MLIVSTFKRHLQVATFALLLSAPAAQAQWSVLPVSTSDVVRSVHFPTTTHGFFVREDLDGSGLYSSTDGGSTWSPVQSSNERGLTNIHFTSELIGFGIDDSGHALLKTLDGGMTWSIVVDSSSSITYFSNLRFVNTMFGYAHGITSKDDMSQRVVVVTRDGGNTWSDISNAFDGDPQFIITAMAFSSATQGLAVGLPGGGTWLTDGAFDYRWYTTTDAGRTWNRIEAITEQLIHAIISPAPNTYGLLGGDSTYHTTDAGITWTQHPLNLGSMFFSMSGFTTNGRFALASAMDWQGIPRVLFTSDGGVTWRLEDTGELHPQQFMQAGWVIDEEHALFSTTTGTIHIRESGTTDIRDEHQIGFHVFPNPITGPFTIERPVGATGDLVITLSDMTGSIVARLSMNETQSSVSVTTDNLAAGLYSVNMFGTHRSWFTKVIK